MESTFLSLGIDVDDIYLYGIITGMLFGLFSGLIDSIINYLNNKAWKVNDYEKALYDLYKYNPYNLVNPCHKIPDFKYTLLGAINRYEKRLQRKEKREKFLNKFRKKRNEK